MWRLLLLLAVFGESGVLTAAKLDPVERRALLDAARPVAAEKTGQPVRIKVETLNVDGKWAMLVGNLVSPSGGPLKWQRVKGCEDDLDKMLWVALNKVDHRWQVKQMYVCSLEPPYWHLEEFGGLVWPCGVYAGLQGADGVDLGGQCRSQDKSKRKD